MHWVFEPGFFSSQPVHVASVIGTIVALVSAVVGVFTVMRGQSFAGHSLATYQRPAARVHFSSASVPCWGSSPGGWSAQEPWR